MIRCTKCDLYKMESEFHIDRRRKNGRTASCKACVKSRSSKYNQTQRAKQLHNSREKQYRRDDQESYLIKNAESRARRLGIMFSLEKIEIPEFCPVLGIPLGMGDGRVQDGSSTIDRIDPTLGYTPENCRVISWRANKIKSDVTLEEMKKIRDYMKREMV